MKRHPEFGSSIDFEYPQHLREAIADLPAAPGVYVFHGDSEVLPLYVSKSVNTRNRVLSHLRNAQESRLIKQQQPLYNQRLAAPRSKPCFRFMLHQCAGAIALARQAAGFDADGYKILCRPILGGQTEIIPVW